MIRLLVPSQDRNPVKFDPCELRFGTNQLAQNHYLQVTDAHFAKAVAETGPAEQAAQNPAQSSGNDRKGQGNGDFPK